MISASIYVIMYLNRKAFVPVSTIYLTAYQKENNAIMILCLVSIYYKSYSAHNWKLKQNSTYPEKISDIPIGFYRNL